MTALQELYRETVLEHYKHPRHYGALTQANHEATGDNPLCGDRVTVYFDVRDGVIQSAGWTHSGCAVSTASTSMMTDCLNRQCLKDALETIQSFVLFMQGPLDTPIPPGLEKLEALAGVKAFPVRIKCALLGWKTAEAALTKQSGLVTTETSNNGNIEQWIPDN